MRAVCMRAQSAYVHVHAHPALSPPSQPHDRADLLDKLVLHEARVGGGLALFGALYDVLRGLHKALGAVLQAGGLLAGHVGARRADALVPAHVRQCGNHLLQMG